MEIGDLAGWAGAVMGALALAENRWDKWRVGQRETLGRLELETTPSGAHAMIIEVRFRPEGAHTRYTVRLEAVRPRDATFSEPGWTDPGRHFALPRPAFDPAKSQHHALTVGLDEGDRENVSAMVALRCSGRKARIRIVVTDEADGSVTLRTERDVTA